MEEETGRTGSGGPLNQCGAEVEGRTATLKGKVGGGPTIHLTASRGSVSVRKEGTLPSTSEPAAPPKPPKPPKNLKETEIEM